jgi:purine-cytosine permease-like protein
VWTLYQHYMFTQQAWGDTRTCTNTICSHNRLGVIQGLVPTLYVHTTGLGWYKDLYQHYMFTQQAWGDTNPKPVVWTYSVGTSLCITPSLLCEHIVLVQVYQHYMFTQQAWGDTQTCTNTICSHNRLGVIQRLVPTLYVHSTDLGW